MIYPVTPNGVEHIASKQLYTLGTLSDLSGNA